VIDMLITGSKGQLGSEFQNIANSYPQLEFTFTDIDELDLTDFDQVKTFIEANSFNYCVNCAGYTAVDKAEDEIEQAFLLNADAVENLAKVCETHKISLIHISTDYVFDGKASKPYKVDDPVAPQSVYGRSKLEGEKAVLKNSTQAMIIRTSWLCSKYGHNFVKTMLHLGAEKKQLKVVNDQLGSPTFASDLVSAILQMIQSGKNYQSNKIYHFSSNGIISWYTFAKRIMDYAGLECEVLPIKTSEFPTRAKRPAYSGLDKSKIIKDFQLDIPSWETSLKNLLNELEN
jgi:dTDP-4-dehydrorhamnose reductase